MKRISLLGSTGSIGVNTLKVIERNRKAFSVESLGAGKNIKLLKEQIVKFVPKVVSVQDESLARKLKNELPSSSKLTILTGMKGLLTVATLPEVDLVVSALGGTIGLIPTLKAIEAKKDVALANKEILVMAGEILMEKSRENKVNILPVDSEQSAVFQSLLGHKKKEARRIILTASGGPFLNYSMEQLSMVSPAETLKHPNWQMGKKVTVDSATLMNKGLEVIEARRLFDIDSIDVCIHPQSIIHSMVEYIDGSVIAQLSAANMQIPIAYALSFPHRIEHDSGCFDFTELGKLTFFPPDQERFPCLTLAYNALEEGGSMPAVLNAADEVAVEAFLDGRIGFTQIPIIVEKTMNACRVKHHCSLEEIIEADTWSRKKAQTLISNL